MQSTKTPRWRLKRTKTEQCSSPSSSSFLPLRQQSGSQRAYEYSQKSAAARGFNGSITVGRRGSTCVGQHCYLRTASHASTLRRYSYVTARQFSFVDRLLRRGFIKFSHSDSLVVTPDPASSINSPVGTPCPKTCAEIFQKWKNLNIAEETWNNCGHNLTIQNPTHHL